MTNTTFSLSPFLRGRGGELVAGKLRLEVLITCLIPLETSLILRFSRIPSHQSSHHHTKKQLESFVPGQGEQRPHLKFLFFHPSQMFSALCTPNWCKKKLWPSDSRGWSWTNIAHPWDNKIACRFTKEMLFYIKTKITIIWSRIWKSLVRESGESYERCIVHEISHFLLASEPQDWQILSSTLRCNQGDIPSVASWVRTLRGPEWEVHEGKSFIFSWKLQKQQSWVWK